MLQFLALKAIGLYQRYLSPLKGYRCAYGLHTGNPSCSAQGVRVFRRAGFFKGMRLLRRQFDRCILASAQLRAAGRSNRTSGSSLPASAAPYPRYRSYGGSRFGAAQRGFVDCDCPGGDCPMPDCPDCSVPDCTPDWRSCDVPSCGGSGPCRLFSFLDCCDVVECCSSESASDRRSNRVVAAATRQAERQSRRNERRAAAENKKDAEDSGSDWTTGDFDHGGDSAD